jgi:hypothetical protein
VVEALANRLEVDGSSFAEVGITGIFAAGKEFTLRSNCFAHEELLGRVFMTQSYGDAMMGEWDWSPICRVVPMMDIDCLLRTQLGQCPSG